MRVILDTNVLLDALISPSGPADIIYRAWRAARFELVTSTAQLDELSRTVLPTMPSAGRRNETQAAEDLLQSTAFDLVGLARP
jgi:predicted nucleic acid-binding protein